MDIRIFMASPLEGYCDFKIFGPDICDKQNARNNRKVLITPKKRKNHL